MSTKRLYVKITLRPADDDGVERELAMKEWEGQADMVGDAYDREPAAAVESALKMVTSDMFGSSREMAEGLLKR